MSVGLGYCEFSVSVFTLLRNEDNKSIKSTRATERGQRSIALSDQLVTLRPTLKSLQPGALAAISTAVLLKCLPNVN